MLPILLVAGVVFGITFIQMYSPDEDRPDTGGGQPKGGPQGLPLKFGVVRVAAPREERNDQGPVPLASHLLHLKYWNSDLEVGAPGHYDFWCQNRHDQPVTVRILPSGLEPAMVQIEPGATVTWVNQSGATRTVLAADASFDSGAMSKVSKPAAA